MTRGWLVMVLAAACVQSGEVPCGDGRICPAGNTCDDVAHRCLSPEQTAACAGLAEGAPCTISSVSGACEAGVCEPHLCGDGVRTDPEACDGSDLGSATCATAGFYAPAGLACTPFCTFDVSACVGKCGDALVNGDELCDPTAAGSLPPGECIDDGFDAGALGCSNACGASFAACGRFGWAPELTTLTFINAMVGSAEDLWTCGQVGGIAAIGHYDGTAWTTAMLIPDMTVCLHMSEAAPGDLWAVGRDPAALVHITNGSATIVTDGPSPSTSYFGVVAFAPDDIVVATSDVGVQHWDGATWSRLGTLPAALGLAGTSDRDLWAVVVAANQLQHWDGTSWVSTPIGQTPVQIDALSPTDAWAVGVSLVDGGGAVAHWDGTAWTALPIEEPRALGAVLARADNDVWVGDADGAALHYDGFGWATTGSFVTAASTGPFTSFVALPGQIAAASTDGVAYRYDGQVYGRFNTGVVSAAEGLWTDSDDDAYAVDDAGNILHFDGFSWSVAFADGSHGAATAIWGTSATDVWAAMTDGTILHGHGSVWTAEPFSAFAVTGMWATGSDDLWVAATEVLRFVGSAAPVSFAPPGLATTISGTGPSDVWVGVAVTQGTGQDHIAGDLYHWDGVGWTLLDHEPGTEISAVAAIGGHLFATTVGNQIVHYDGAVWTRTTVLVPSGGLIAIGGSAPDDVFAASADRLYHYDGSRWSSVRIPDDPVVAGLAITALFVRPATVDLLYQGGQTPSPFRRLIRTRPWNCRAKETDCADGVDDDCDGLVDGRDPDCQP